MTLIGLVCLSISAYIIYRFFVLKWKLRQLPSGPAPLPLLGNLLSLREDAHLFVTDLRKYGEVSSISVFHTPLVVLNSFKAINEAYVVHSDVFSGRPTSGINHAITRKSGIIFTEGALWKEHRRCCVRALRDFGFMKSISEDYAKEECSDLVNFFKDHEGQPIATQEIFSKSSCNIISRLVFGERVGSNDPNFKIFYKHLKRSFEQHPLFFFPVLNWTLEPSPIAKILDYVIDFRTAADGLHLYIRDKIDEREKQLQSMSNPPTETSQANDLVDYLLIEKFNQEKKNSEGHTFREWQLIRNVTEFFGAGTDTTASTMHWAILLVATHPDIQAKMQEEISEAIGHERLPNNADRQSLPYMAAVMDEVLRFSSLISLSLLHRAQADIDFFGYHIPEDTCIISNLYGVHHDPQHWEYPNQFYPGHFLDESGGYKPSKFLIPFSIGKRACPGEPLAKMEFFLLLVSILQTFHVKVADPNANRDELLRGSLGVSLMPQEHQIIFTKL